MSSPIDIYSKILTAVPDIIRDISKLYVSGRGETTSGSNESSRTYGSVGLPPSGESSGVSTAPSVSDSFQGLRSVTGARPALRPFVIGFIPPDVRVSFVPVDRSISAVDIGGNAGGEIVNTVNIDTAGSKRASDLPDSFYRALVKVAHAIGCRPSDLLLILHTESGINPAAANHVDGDPNKPIQAIGLNQITEIALKAAGLTEEFWRGGFRNLTAEQQLPYVQNYFAHQNRGSYQNAVQLKLANFAPGLIKKATSSNSVLYAMHNPDGSINNKWKQNRGINPTGDITVGSISDRLLLKSNTAAFRSQLSRLKSVVGSAATRLPPPGGGGANTITSISTAGEIAPGTFEAPPPASGIMMTGNISSPEPDDPLLLVGRNLVLSDRRREVVNKQLEELNNQIDVANSIPSLLMLINPQEFSRSYEHQVDVTKGRRGPIVSMWLEKPLSISGKGVTAAQYAFSPGKKGGGLTNLNRVHSLSYANLMSLVMTYRNNGHLYTQAVTGDSQNFGIPVISMSVYIYYDGNIYIGSFDDFSVTDDAEKPYNLSYSWNFTARYHFDVLNDDQTISSVVSDLLRSELISIGELNRSEPLIPEEVTPIVQEPTAQEDDSFFDVDVLNE